MTRRGRVRADPDRAPSRCETDSPSLKEKARLSMTPLAVAISSALLRVWTTDTFFSAFPCANNIEYRSANDKHDRGDCYIINDTHNQTLRAYSALSCLFFLTIIKAKTKAIARMIAQPTIGIQAAPKLPPVKSVPKKNTRKPMVYPTEN